VTPYGRVPVLQIEGQRPIAQSGAILRYLARKFDLNGKNEEETVRADEIYGFFGDCTKNIVPYLVVHAGLSEGNKVFNFLCLYSITGVNCRNNSTMRHLFQPFNSFVKFTIKC
jgi:hypothetical protein